jgi:hypothetical protein
MASKQSLGSKISLTFRKFGFFDERQLENKPISNGFGNLF